MEQAQGGPLEPGITAVVITHNGGNRVIRCLQKLQQQTARPARTILVDSGSTDDTIARIKTDFPAISIHELGNNLGPGAARNAGLNLAETDLVLVVDDDIYLDESCLENLSMAMQAGGASVVCPRFVIYPEGEIVQFDGAAPHFVGTLILRHGYQPVGNLPLSAAAVDGCGSGCLLLQRTEILDAGSFSEAFFIYFEDLEFSYRLRSLGYRIICEPKAVAYHDLGRRHPGLSFRGGGSYPTLRAYLTVRNRLLTIFIHYRVRSLVVLSPALLLYEFAGAAILMVRGRLRQWGRAWLWMWQNKNDILRWRKQAQQGRAVSDRRLLHGGPLPLAPGFVDNRLAIATVALLSAFLNLYWRAFGRWIG
jgi:GT2 family glycosyltransferase